MLCVTRKCQIYTDANMLNEHEKMAKLVTEERRVLTGSLHTAPVIHELFRTHICKWIAWCPGTYIEEIVQELMLPTMLSNLRANLDTLLAPPESTPESTPTDEDDIMVLSTLFAIPYHHRTLPMLLGSASTSIALPTLRTPANCEKRSANI
uniref:Integrase core domain containing protein n=1 Tax=Solanum tuberosum TaxID=4113 RepID=M1D9X9_SOLTU